MVTHVPGPSARRALTGTRFAALEWVAETTSTQADVLELARQGASEGQVVVADHQSGGRGRAGRSWEAPAGTSILMSILLRPPAPVASMVTALLGLSAADAIEAVTGFRPDLKWPNDLVVTDEAGTTRKLAGILAEADWPPGADMASGWRDPKASERVVVIAGIGINVNWPAEIPDELADIAISCNHVTGNDHDRVGDRGPAAPSRSMSPTPRCSRTERRRPWPGGAGRCRRSVDPSESTSARRMSTAAPSTSPKPATWWSRRSTASAAPSRSATCIISAPPDQGSVVLAWSSAKLLAARRWSLVPVRRRRSGDRPRG